MNYKGNENIFHKPTHSKSKSINYEIIETIYKNKSSAIRVFGTTDILNQNKKDKKLKIQIDIQATTKKKLHSHNVLLVSPVGNKEMRKISSKLLQVSSKLSINYNEALENFNQNYDQLIHNLKHKKDFLNVLNEETSTHMSTDHHIPRRRKFLQTTKKSSKILPRLSTSKLNAFLDESFEYSYGEKDNFQDFNKFFTPEVYKKYSALPKKEFCLPKNNVKLDDEVFYDLLVGRKKLLIIDLVETIIRVKHECYNDSVIEDVMNELETNYSLHVGENELQIQLRPGLMQFLNKMILHYHIVIFTSSSKNYAEPILNFIDENHYFFKYRLYQEHCSRINNGIETIFLKDLRIFDGIEKICHNVVCVDDDLMSFAFNIENAIPIIPFSQNPCCYSSDDDELWFLEKFLGDMSHCEDVRKELSLRRKSDFEDKMKRITKFIECFN